MTIPRFFPALPLLIGSLLLLTTVGIPTGAQERVHTLTGTFQTVAKFHSRFLTDDRDVTVWLPPGYAQATRARYPVLYLHDGQNLFDGATSFIPGKEWQADETAQSLVTSGEVEPVLIVGIANAGAQRLNEYTPTATARFPDAGKADAYGRFLVEELKPYIDAHFRTRRDARNTGLGGSSLGGLVSLHLGLKYPRVFGKLAILSPSVWWDNNEIVGEVQKVSSRPQTRLWLDIGGAEGQEAVAGAHTLRDALIARGWTLNRDLAYQEAPDAAHNETAWAARFPDILRFLFPARKR